MSEPQVRLSSAAAKRINAIMSEHKKTALRVAVVGGGCSGFSYTFDFADAPEKDDLVIKRDGAMVVIDNVSLDFLAGSEIDYSDELIGAAFKINNPNAKSGCGCGTSFSI
ncbi:MAG: iron-sulfur cluster insertion protein ErpA [Robiginitomaculum sp.]|nr:iron-sulfur cluster insertion protein ErpA [Robiginitomaculum sp.]MDQ7077604.1 iron-sulfur cluster insertion protein ErpA [Robiginitomaculum sp.]